MSFVSGLINILIMVSSTILNATTVLAYWKSSQLRNKTSYFLIMLLSTSDLGTSMRCSSMHSIILLRDMLGCESSSLTLPYMNLIYVLGIPRFMTVTYRKHSNQIYIGLLLWSKINKDVRNVNTWNVFKHAIRNVDFSFQSLVVVFYVTVSAFFLSSLNYTTLTTVHIKLTHACPPVVYTNQRNQSDSTI